MRKPRRLLLVAVMALGLVPAAIAPAFISANTIGEGEGCTPGYWKNHTDSWEELRTDMTVAQAFPGYTGTLGSMTLLQALNGGGGTGLVGAERILLRAAVAAQLNAAHEELDYPFTRFPRAGSQLAIIDAVNAALASGDRDRILALADRLDRANNAGCPLN